MIKIYAPASIGNINVGFDILGLAITPIDNSLLGDCVSIEVDEKFNLINSGKFSHILPKDYKKNIVYQCWKIFCKKFKKNFPMKIQLEKNMPTHSGLGSSASSIVASLVGINTFCGNLLNKYELLLMMGILEGQFSGSIHYDNVAPCFFGGMQLILEQKNIISQNIAVFEDWIWVVAYPGIQIATSEAREILPEHYSKKDCIAHSRSLAGFLHACYTQQKNLAVSCMIDIIAEPYRKKLIPNFIKIKQSVLNLGALTYGISGSGPTIFALCDHINIAKNVSEYLIDNYLENNQGFVKICHIDKIGARTIGIK